MFLRYRSAHIYAVIAFDCYCLELIDQRYRFYSLSLFCYYIPAFKFLNPYGKITSGRSKFLFVEFTLYTCNCIGLCEADIAMSS
jgi:hypothetical protein